MPAKLQPNAKLAALDADEKPVKASHFDSVELRANQDTTVYRERKPDDKFQFWGHGGNNRQVGTTVHKYADLVASGNGTGDAGDQIEADVIVAITDSDGRILAERQVGDVSTLADAMDETRTERPMMPALAPYLEQGRYREIIINADEASDGVELDTTESSARFWYSEL